MRWKLFISNCNHLITRSCIIVYIKKLFIIFLIIVYWKLICDYLVNVVRVLTVKTYLYIIFKLNNMTRRFETFETQEINYFI